MQSKFVIREGKWFLLGDDRPVPAKFFKLAKFVKQGKIKGEVVFTYDYESDGDVILKSLKIKKVKTAKVKTKTRAGKKSKKKQQEISIVDLQDSDIEPENLQTIDVDLEEIKYSPLINKNRKVKFIDDPNVGKGDDYEERKHKQILTNRKVDPRLVGAPPPKPTVMRCSCCGRDVKVPAWEANMRRQAEGSFYRCNKCYGN